MTFWLEFKRGFAQAWRDYWAPMRWVWQRIRAWF